MLRIAFILFLLFTINISGDNFINPLTDVCWECLFPITVSGINIIPGKEDLNQHSKRVCICPGVPPKMGVPLTFWEPMRMVDVTRHAYKLCGFGGIQLGNESVRNRGSIGTIEETSTTHSFYHVHWYEYPLLSLLGIFTDFSCVDKGGMDVGYMSELDPLWNDDILSAILNPEAGLFGNPLAQLTCISDCATSTFSSPNDALFWCAGCEGSLYPFTGNVAHHINGAQASSLLLQRTIARLHRLGAVKGFGKNDFCEPKIMPIIKKSLYKTQLMRPVAQTSGPCQALGKSDLIWGSGTSIPGKTDDFVYLIWIKKQCCLDAVKPAVGSYL